MAAAAHAIPQMDTRGPTQGAEEPPLKFPLPICGFDTGDNRWQILVGLGVGSPNIPPEPDSRPVGAARVHKCLLRVKEAPKDEQNAFAHAVTSHADGFGEDVGEYVCHIFVRMPERSIYVPICQGETVFSLKAKIYDMEGIHPDQQRLSYLGHPLEDAQTLKSLNVVQDSTIQLVLRLPGGHAQSYHLDPSIFDSQFDFDFSQAKDSGKVYTRGGFVFKRPYGWHRVGLNVIGQFPEDTWLGVAGSPAGGNRAQSVDGEWAVSYHGTGLHHGKTIAQEGYESLKQPRFMYGVYTTPDINVAQLFAPVHLTPDGRPFMVIVQNRVNPATLTRVSKQETKLGEFWISPTTDDVRPYSICVKYLDSPAGGGKKDSGCVIC